MYAFIQSLRSVRLYRGFQTNGNIIRYIIGDKEGTLSFINLVHGKLRTPKNIRFNDLIKFFNTKYLLNIATSVLNNSNLNNNYWFTGFTEADGHFAIKYVQKLSKSITRKR